MGCARGGKNKLYIKRSPPFTLKVELTPKLRTSRGLAIGLIVVIDQPNQRNLALRRLMPPSFFLLRKGMANLFKQCLGGFSRCVVADPHARSVRLSPDKLRLYFHEEFHLGEFD